VHRDLSRQHSPVIGYAFDGFKIHGLLGERGQPPKDLDQCNGHTDSNRGCHYHTTEKFPFVLGCYRGTPASANYDRNQQRGGGNERGSMRRGSDPVRQYCEADRKRYCANMPPSREMMQCMCATRIVSAPSANKPSKTTVHPASRQRYAGLKLQLLFLASKELSRLNRVTPGGPEISYSLSTFL
jgi:hypothetical protein